jgi:hypothetical protein
MILDTVTPAQMQAARILTGVTMCGLMGAQVFGRWAQKVRIGLLAFYLLGILLFVVMAVG